jgi:hypothetical protein
LTVEVEAWRLCERRRETVGSACEATRRADRISTAVACFQADSKQLTEEGRSAEKGGLARGGEGRRSGGVDREMLGEPTLG